MGPMNVSVHPVRVFRARLAPTLLIAALLVALHPVHAQSPMPSTTARPTTATAHAERPLAYDVEHYRIDVRFDEKKSTVSGNTTVRVKSLEENFSTLELDAAELDVSNISLDGGAPLSFTVDAAAQKLRIALDRPYAVGESFGVTVAYSAKPKRGVYFFRRQPGTPDAAPTQFWTQGETNDNRYWFPCWDSPNDKATSEVLMTINGRFTGVSNGALISTRKNSDGTKTLHWMQDKPHATYLIMVAAGDFTEVKDSWRGKPITYIVPSAKAGWAKRSYGKTPRMIEFFSKRIGYDYPWAKYSQVAITNFMFGGMENTTATTLTETTLLPPGVRPTAGTDGLIAHEAAHQWFGDLVSPRDWPHAWLSEGFATYFAYLWVEHDRGHDAFLREMRNAADENMRSAAATRRPLVYNVYREPFDLFFDGTIYPKGAWVLHMLRSVVGDEAFWKGLNLYVTRHAFGLVTTDDLQAVMEETSGQKLDWFFEQWTKKAGYPDYLVSTSFNPETNLATVRVTQRQGQTDMVPVFRMPLDLNIETQKGSRMERILVDSADKTFAFQLDSEPKKLTLDPGEWVLKKVEYATTTVPK